MTVEDRLRATTEAVTAAMRPLRPLNLNGGAQAPAGPRRPRLLGRWRPHLIPLTAAVAVIAVAGTLVAVRDLSGAGPGPRPASAPAPAAALANGIPRYYLAFSSAGAYFDNRTARTASLGDTVTGRQLAAFTAPAGTVFTRTAASADGKTFVVLATPGGASDSPASASWYALRVIPGASRPPRLARIPIASSAFTAASVAVKGFAVSPDGRTLAVLTQAITGGVPKVAAGPVTLRTYSLVTGRALRTWPAPASTALSATFTDLTWLNDGHTLAFAADGHNIPSGVRTLDTAGPPAGLLAGSRMVFHAPDPVTCNAGMLLSADGKAVICGSEPVGGNECATGRLALTAYSVATGKLERVLYRYRGSCIEGIIRPEWAGSATRAIALLFTVKRFSPPLVQDTLVVTGTGTSAPLPVTVQRGGLFYPYDIAF